MGEPEVLGPIIDHSNGGIAVDGRQLPQTAMTAGHVIDMLEEGQFSEDLHREIVDLIATLNDQSGPEGNKVKGEVMIKIKFEKEDNAFKISADKKITKPTVKRPRTHAWCDEHNRLTRFPPGQGQFFGTGRPVRAI